MEKSNTVNSGITFFREFCKNPRNFSLEIVQGAHKYISLVLAKKVPSVKKSILVGIFNEYIDQPVKDYVFLRIPKNHLLELALTIFQDIIEKGVERAASLCLELINSVDGDKTIAIAPNTGGAAGSEAFSAREVMEASFSLTDPSGLSPDVSFSVGKGRGPPYRKPDDDGYFTPRKSARKSLEREFQVL